MHKTDTAGKKIGAKTFFQPRTARRETENGRKKAQDAQKKHFPAYRWTPTTRIARINANFQLTGSLIFLPQTTQITQTGFFCKSNSQSSIPAIHYPLFSILNPVPLNRRPEPASVEKMSMCMTRIQTKPLRSTH
jgi:hypothetical protein